MTKYTYFIGVSLGQGAVPDHFRALGGELVRRGHQVIYLPWGANAGNQEITSGNPQIHPWPSSRPTHWADACFLYRMIRLYRPHCLIANFGAVNLMLVVGKLAGVPVRVAWHRTLSSQLDMDWTGSFFLKKMLRLRKRAVLRCSTHLVANSKASLRDLTRVYHVPMDKCIVFYNTLRDPIHQGEIQSSKRPINVVCVGRFYPTKGQDVLIEAIAYVRHRTGEKVNVRFVGNGPTLSQCKARAKALGVGKMCSFIGSVSHDQVLEEMSTADVVVVPSRSEAFGLVAIESLAVGTPVVASRVGGLAEIIRDGVDGFLVPPDDPKELAERLCFLLENREACATMGVAARERFLSTFEQSKNVCCQAD